MGEKYEGGIWWRNMEDEYGREIWGRNRGPGGTSREESGGLGEHLGVSGEGI